jgi:hypothetical protein
MLEYLYLANWDQTFGFLTAGSPPMFVRLMALNALFLGLYAIRKAAGAQAMSAGATLFVQLAVMAANLLVLFQPEAENFIRGLTGGY